MIFHPHNSIIKKVSLFKGFKRVKKRQKTERKNKYYKNLFSKISEFISQNMKKIIFRNK